MPENVNYYHITPLINDLARYFNKYRLVSVESKELGIKLELIYGVGMPFCI